MPRKLALVLAALLACALLAPAAVGAEEDTDPRFPTEPVVVAEDLTGDWGGGGHAGQVGAALGMDLEAASIAMPDADTVDFVLDVTSLPPVGGTPEVPRYTWELSIDGVQAQLDGKFTNYSRGICDPTSGQCSPTEGKLPRDPGLQPFFFRGNCGVIETPAINFNGCEELAVVQARFDAAAGTITVPVPVEVIDLLDEVEFGDCSTIATGPEVAEGGIVARASAFLSFTGGAVGAALSDGMFIEQTFTAPPAADAEVDCAGNPLDG